MPIALPYGSVTAEVGRPRLVRPSQSMINLHSEMGQAWGSASCYRLDTIVVMCLVAMATRPLCDRLNPVRELSGDLSCDGRTKQSDKSLEALVVFLL